MTLFIYFGDKDDVLQFVGDRLHLYEQITITQDYNDGTYIRWRIECEAKKVT